MNDDDDDKHQRPVFGLHPAIDKLGESSFMVYGTTNTNGVLCSIEEKSFGTD